MPADGFNAIVWQINFTCLRLNVRFSRKQTFRPIRIPNFQHPLSADTVEKLCFEMSGDFICDLNGIAYCMYEGVAEVV